MALAADWLSGLLRRAKPKTDASDQGSTNAQTGTMSTTGGELDQEPVVVWEAANLMEAEVVKGRLQSAGIPALVRGEALGAIYGLTTGGLAAADVLVPAALAAKALDLLADVANGEIDDSEFTGAEADEESIDVDDNLRSSERE